MAKGSSRSEAGLRSDQAIEGNIRSRRLPGGDLVSAVLFRPLMALADRGGASGMVGQRWADICAERVNTWSGNYFSQLESATEPLVLEHVIRLDDDPALVLRASKAAVQNSDFLFLGRSGETPVIWAIDAKFSIETARSKQVSIETLSSLLPILEETGYGAANSLSDRVVIAGAFLSPDYPITTLMLNGRTGIRRTSVSHSQVVRVPVQGSEFFQPLASQDLMAELLAIDDLSQIETDGMMAGLYYFRLARACVGCWLEEMTPALSESNSRKVPGQADVISAIRERGSSQSAYALVAEWDQRVEHIRSQKQVLEKAAGLPVANRDLKDMIEREARRTGVTVPSTNQVRKQLERWHRKEMTKMFGPIALPVTDLPQLQKELIGASSQARPQIANQIRRVVSEMSQEQPVALSEADIEQGF